MERNIENRCQRHNFVCLIIIIDKMTVISSGLAASNEGDAYSLLLIASLLRHKSKWI